MRSLKPLAARRHTLIRIPLSRIPLIGALHTLAVILLCVGTSAHAQSVCLPSPRLLTMLPMGGQAGTKFDVSVTGQWIDGAEQLFFSTPGITAVPKLDAQGEPVSGKFTVTVAADCPTGIHEARLWTRLGLSASRVFSVSSVQELTQEKHSTSPETAMPLPLNSICNATMPVRAVNHYSFQAGEGQRVLVECAAGGIESKLKAVLIVADDAGRDLKVERRGGTILFTAPAEGTYLVKVHELTFGGGADYFYRLSLRTVEGEDIPKSMPAVADVNAFSWPPHGLASVAADRESESDERETQAITLPCDIAGKFFPAADVDRYEFSAKKGDVWWVEVASQRLGRPTDPAVLIQKMVGDGDAVTFTDVAELNDIESPVKVSSNGYAYDGPPYNAGSSDVLGKFEAPSDGRYRLQVRDLFGGTRSDPRNVYRLVIRKAQPDFAVVGWALHMMLRNGDRNALSKPISLRRGATMALEMVAIRRDGFDGPIELKMMDLPEGVRATGLTIPAGQSRGVVLVTADENAPRGFTHAKLVAEGTVDGELLSRPVALASMRWPVKDGRSEIPNPRLLADVPVSVGGVDSAPITIAPAEQKVYEATVGQTLTIPLRQTRRSEFSGANLAFSTLGGSMEKNPKFDVALSETETEAKVDLAKLKTPPGDYIIAFYGGAVVKYEHNPDTVVLADSLVKKLRADAEKAAAESQRLIAEAKAATSEGQTAIQTLADKATEQAKAAEALLAQAVKKLKAARAAAKSKDTAEIIVSEPISIRVLPENKS